MSEQENGNAQRIISPEFTIVWPHLFKPYHYQNKQDQAKFSVEMMFDQTEVDTQAMVDAAREAAKKKWPNRAMKGLFFPFKDGNKIADAAKEKGKNHDYYRGYLVIRAKSTYQPVICDADYNNIIDERRIFSGCKGVAELTFAAYENAAAGDGVTCYLNAYMHTAEGERIGGRSASRIFGGVQQSNEDPEQEDDDDEIAW